MSRCVLAILAVVYSWVVAGPGGRNVAASGSGDEAHQAERCRRPLEADCVVEGAAKEGADNAEAAKEGAEATGKAAEAAGKGGKGGKKVISVGGKK